VADEIERLAVGPNRPSDRAVLTVTGELDAASFTQLRRHLNECFSDGCKDVTIDLSGVTFIDSAGIGVIVGAMRQLNERRGRLTLAQPSPAVRKVLEITGLAAQMDIVDPPTP
jgi:anti-anti-sigma factor